MAEEQVCTDNTPLQALIEQGADAMTNMYDVFFKFGTGAENALSARGTKFDIPEAETGVYQVKYKGTTYDKPKTEMTFDRKFSIDFRLDSGYGLLDTFQAFHKITANPATGGVANAIPRQSMTVIVRALKAPAILAEGFTDFLTGTSSSNGFPGTIKAPAEKKDETVREWVFYDTWITKVGQPKYKNDGADAITVTVDFRFGQCKFPGYTPEKKD